MSFKNSFKQSLFSIHPQNFNEKALELFRFQAENNLVYKKYINLLNIVPSDIHHYTEIPFLPINFFKNFEVLTGSEKIQAQFKSSGTTGQIRSTHPIMDLSFYEQVSERIFESFYGSLNQYTLLALLPSYEENEQSSLIHMIKKFMGKTDTNSAFVSTDYNLLAKKISLLKKEQKKILLFGVSFALLEFAEKYILDLSDCIIIETGGMKGRGEEKIREEIHAQLKSSFAIKEIHSEYGMTELISQAYSLKNGVFSSPPWMQVLTREINDPFAINNRLNSGGINIIDLANVDSCAFLETQDVGKVIDEKSFQVIGRFDNSDARGCNLLLFNA